MTASAFDGNHMSIVRKVLVDTSVNPLKKDSENILIGTSIDFNNISCRGVLAPADSNTFNMFIVMFQKAIAGSVIEIH